MALTRIPLFEDDSTSQIPATPSQDPNPNIDIVTLLNQASERYGVDPDLVRRVAHQESRNKPGAVSPKGAVGVMQTLPGTFSDMGGKDINDPAQQIDAGVKYLRKQLDDFGGDTNLALAAYNAGPGAVRKAGGVPNFKETLNYIKKIQGQDVVPGTAAPKVQPQTADSEDYLDKAYRESRGLKRIPLIAPEEPVELKPDVKPVAEDGDFVRSVKNYYPQIKEMFGAIQTIGGAAAKKVGLNDFGDSLILGGIERIDAAKGDQKGKPTDSFTQAYDQGGIPALIADWLPYQAGQAVGNLGEAAVSAVAGGLIGSAVGGPAAPVSGATGVVGGLLFKTLVKRGVIEEAKAIAEREGVDVAKAFIKKESGKLIGLNIGIATSAVYHGAGEVGERMLDTLREKGIPVDQIDLGRFAASATGHAFLEFVGDKIGLGAVTKPLDKSFGGGAAGFAKNVAARGVSTGAKEAPVEVGQTGFERFGAELPLTGPEARTEYIDSGAAGFGMGLVTGAGGGAVHSLGQPANTQQPTEPLPNTEPQRRSINIPQPDAPIAPQTQYPTPQNIVNPRQNPVDQLSENLSGRPLSDVELADIEAASGRRQLQLGTPNATISVNGAQAPVTVHSYAGLGPDGLGYVNVADQAGTLSTIPLSSITNANRDTVAQLRREVAEYKKQKGTAAPQTVIPQEIQNEVQSTNKVSNAQAIPNEEGQNALLNQPSPAIAPAGQSVTTDVANATNAQTNVQTLQEQLQREAQRKATPTTALDTQNTPVIPGQTDLSTTSEQLAAQNEPITPAPEAELPAEQVIAPQQRQRAPSENLIQAVKDAGEQVSFFPGQYGKGMNRTNAKLKASQLNAKNTDKAITYTAEEHNDPKLQFPYAVVGRQRIFGLKDDSASPSRVVRGSVDAQSNKSTPDVLEVGADRLADLLESTAFQSQGFRGFDVPTQRTVLSQVVGLLHDDKVLRRVIELVPVDVMNVLVGKEGTPENLRHHVAMLSDQLAIDGDLPVPALIDAAGVLASITATEVAVRANIKGKAKQLLTDALPAEVARNNDSRRGGSASTGIRAVEGAARTGANARSTSGQADTTSGALNDRQSTPLKKPNSTSERAPEVGNRAADVGAARGQKDAFDRPSVDNQVDNKPPQVNETAPSLPKPEAKAKNEPPIVKYRKLAEAIEKNAPEVTDGFTRLWRGNRPGEVGKNPQFTNSLAGIALPFRDAYGGQLSYVDVPTKDLGKYENIGIAASGSEFILPQEIAAQAIAIDKSEAKASEGTQDTFVKAPDGSTNFGEITSEQASAMHRQAGKIRLEVGNSEYGLAHIEERHGKEIRAIGFDSVEAFVSDAVKHIDAIWKPSKTSQLVVVQSVEQGKAVFIELKPANSGDYYTVNTAFPVGEEYGKNKKGWSLLWGGASVPTVASGANPLAVSSPKAGATTTMTPGQSSDANIAPTTGNSKAAELSRVNARLDAAGITGTERLTIIAAFNRGDLTAQDVEEAHPTGPKSEIKDIGEKIGGARKDIWQSYKDKISDAKDVDVKAEPLSKSWPVPDYEALLESGADSYGVAFMHAARDEIPTKPSVGYKLNSWVEKVKMLRDFAAQIAGGSLSSDRLRQELANTQALSGIAGRIELYMAVGHSQSLRGVSISAGSYGIYNSVEYSPPKVIWTVEKKAKATAFSNWPRTLAEGSTKEEALSNFKEKFASLEIDTPASKDVKFEVYATRGENGYRIGKKMGRNQIMLSDPFATVKEAREYMRSNQDELVKKLEAAKQIPSVRRDTNEPRIGEDMRDGKDVTPEMFQESFGFRGVEFGNWVEQKKRQKDLNEAYDALMDMAAVIGVTPKALSLNGELGLAFGARGKGGIDPAKAHYEPSYVVINLTKKDGAGSIGHEWFHALDNYFSRMRGKKSEFMTDALDVSLASRGSAFVANTAVRKEMIEAFGGVMKAIKSTALKARSSKLDAKRSKEYWSTGLEMAARSYESYLISKLQDQNASNDYLANIVSEETWRVAEQIGFELDESYPYPTAGEVPAIRAAFDHFFQTIETKQTDSGTSLFSRSDQSTEPGLAVSDVQAVADLITRTWKNAPRIHVLSDWADSRVPADLKFNLKKTNAINTASAALHNGEIYLNAAKQQTAEQAEFSVLHESTHLGLEGMFGKKALDQALMNIYLSNKQVRTEADRLTKKYKDLTRTAAVNEILADKGGNKEFASAFDRLKAWFLTQLRKLGFTVSIGDAELRALVSNALAYSKDKAKATHVFNGSTFSRGNSVWEHVVEAWNNLGSDMATFQNPTPDSFDMESAAREIDPGMQAQEETPDLDEKRDMKLAHKWIVKMPDGTIASIYENQKGEVWLNAANLAEGVSGGSKLYLLVGSYAEANGKVFIGDPAGLSDVALLRRTENMVSLALRFGRTDFMMPHEYQMDPGAKLDTVLKDVARPINWVVGDDENNLAELLKTSYANTVNLFPEIKNVTYNFDNQRFEQDGQEFTDFDGLTARGNGTLRQRGLAKILSSRKPRTAVGEAKDQSPVGSATLKRAAITNTVARAEGASGRRSVLAAISAVVSRGLSGTPFQGTQYSRQASHLDNLQAELAGNGNPPPSQFSRGYGEAIRSVAGSDNVRGWVASTFDNDKSLSPWMRSVGTQYHKAVTLEKQGMPHFKRVFDLGQDFLSDISAFAIRAEKRAPHMFKRAEGLGDLIRGGVNRKDVEAISKPLFEGTLNEKRVFTDAELTRKYRLTAPQVVMYREALAAANQSLDDVAKALIAKHAQVHNLSYTRDSSLSDLADEVGEQVNDADLMKKIRDIAAKPAQLAAEGYFPLMRFGNHTVTMTDQEGETQFFGLYESQHEANKVKAALAEDNRGMHIETGIMSKEAFKLYGGLNLEALQLFANEMDVSDNPMYQGYLKNAVNNRSVLKRLIHRKGTPGFSTDVERTLAQFITSNARHASSQYNLFKMREAAEAVPKRYGDVKDEAIKLWEYVSNPVEEASKLRGYLFFNFLGGSVASAMVNLTQVPMMTAPYLSQYTSAGGLLKAITTGAKMALLNPAKVSGALGVALRRAEEMGVTAPQEIHQLTATASNNLFSSNHKWNAALKAWGGMFSMAEVFNRRSTFIAAFNIAKERGYTDKAAYDFARVAVDETQGIYTKANRPNWARGTAGSLIFTFKQYSIAYIELFKRLPPKQQLIMLGVLILASGLEGLPFEEDLLDLIDTLGQWGGFATSSKRWLRETATATLGKQGAALALNGISAVLPIDLQGRMGMHNLLPGTSVLKQSEVNKGRDVQEFAGPAGSVLVSAADALEQLAKGNFARAALAIAPRAVINAYEGGVMLATGEAKDKEGRKVLDVSITEGAGKAIGFNPTRKAELSEHKRALIQDRNLLRVKEDGIVTTWVNGILKNKPEEIAAAKRELADWNEKNPDLRIAISPNQIKSRVRNARIDSDVRFIRSLPKEQRLRARGAFEDGS